MVLMKEGKTVVGVRLLLKHLYVQRVHLYTCTLVHLYTCTLVHLYTCTLVHLETYPLSNRDARAMQALLWWWLEMSSNKD